MKRAKVDPDDPATGAAESTDDAPAKKIKVEPEANGTAADAEQQPPVCVWVCGWGGWGMVPPD